MTKEALYTQDPEMQEAMAELKQAQDMYDNAANKYRMDEAYHRMQAAESRIQAIRYERGGVERADNITNRCKLDFIRRRMYNARVAGKGGCR